jgi:hypothetical protein
LPDPQPVELNHEVIDMTAVNFCYWLQGLFELTPAADSPPAVGISPQQAEVIRRHLNTVFAHDIDPKAGGPDVQSKLNAIHHGDSDVKLRC